MSSMEIAGSFTKQFFEHFIQHSPDLEAHYSPQSTVIVVGDTHQPHIFVGNACVSALCDTLSPLGQFDSLNIEEVKGTELPLGVEVLVRFGIVNDKQKHFYVLWTILEKVSDNGFFIRSQTLVSDGVVELPPSCPRSSVARQVAANGQDEASHPAATSSIESAAEVATAPAAAAPSSSSNEITENMTTKLVSKQKPSSWAQVTRMSAKNHVETRVAPVKVAAELPKPTGSRKAMDAPRQNTAAAASTAAATTELGDRLLCHIRDETTTEAIMSALENWSKDIADIRYIKEKNVVFIDFKRQGMLDQLQKANVSLENQRLTFKPAKPREVRS